MANYFMNKQKNSKVIMANPNKKKGFITLSGKGYQGAHIINEDIVASHFTPCTKDHYEYYKKKGK